MPNLLFEIGSEQLPAGYIKPALKQMETSLAAKLKEARLNFKRIYATGSPRRLALFAEDIDAKQESVVKEVAGPSQSVAFDQDGNATNAGKGFAKSQGVDVSELKIKETKKGKYCYAIKTMEGCDTIKLLPEILLNLMKSAEFPKKMIWKSGGVTFARPIRTIAALFGSEIVNLELNGVKSGRVVMGNPYYTSPEHYGTGKAIALDNADLDTYKQKLMEEKVIVDLDERRDKLLAGVNSILSKYKACFDDNDLLDELTNLVEFPTAIECGFDEKFLAIPEEVTIAAMKGHQKYCPVIGDDKRFYPKFVSVLNMDEAKADKARDGNERVLRARLADAEFFLAEDKKRALSDRVKDLETVTYHKKLGALLDRTNRIVSLAGFIAKRLNYADNAIKDVERAAYLCKADLTTSMVGEFPELQGVMGRFYSANDGEPIAVATAVEEHYLPRYANDRLPESEAGAVVSLADKFEAIAGCFAIGLIPTGSQDPYALRRSAQGILRIIEDKGACVSIRDVANHALSNLPGKGDGETVNKVLDFFKDRLYNTFIDRGFKYDIINAALATGIDDIVDLTNRLQTITDMSQEKFWPELVTVIERTYNISKTHDGKGDVDANLMTDPEEKALWEAYGANSDKIRQYIENKDYKNASLLFCETFTAPVHTFFDKVFVNVDDEKVKNNRLLILRKIYNLYAAEIADLSKIVIAEN